MPDYRRLKVWEKAHETVLRVYAASTRFPSVERFGLTAQIRRAAVSVPSNIAEGSGRRGDGDFRRFVAFALGSSHELEYQLLLARELGYLKDADHAELSGRVVEVGRMLSALLARLRPSSKRAA
jgi:four helix bundle protein